MEIYGCELVQTCDACPEQYDVFKSGEKIGYLRLRHGYFRADYPDCGGETVFEANPIGDGVFDSDEREGFLKDAVASILMYINKNPKPKRPHEIWEETSPAE